MKTFQIRETHLPTFACEKYRSGTKTNPYLAAFTGSSNTHHQSELSDPSPKLLTVGAPGYSKNRVLRER